MRRWWTTHGAAECIDACRLGDDADTTGAVCGQIAGAFYGEDGIPEAWRQCLVMHEQITELAEKLL